MKSDLGEDLAWIARFLAMIALRIANQGAVEQTVSNYWFAAKETSEYTP